MNTSRPLTMPTLPSGLSFVISRCLSDCGLTASQPISLFYRQGILERGMPFQIKSFNEQTRRVLKNSEKGIEVEQFESADALFEFKPFEATWNSSAAGLVWRVVQPILARVQGLALPRQVEPSTLPR